MAQIKGQELKVSFSALVDLYAGSRNRISAVWVRDRPSRATNHFAKAFDFVVAQKSNLVKLVHALFFNKGLSSSLRESDAGHNPAHNSVVHGEPEGTEGTKTGKPKIIRNGSGFITDFDAPYDALAQPTELPGTEFVVTTAIYNVVT
jgi:hypothetical protein